MKKDRWIRLIKNRIRRIEDLKYIEDHKNDVLLSDLGNDKEDILHEILLKEIKLEKLEILEITINAIKKWIIAWKVKTVF